jgi:hypothetical protein
MPVCPKCHRDDHIIYNGSHYVCTYENCPGMKPGVLSQFYVKEDEKLHFPYNIIFSNRKKDEFFRLPYITYSEQ